MPYKLIITEAAHQDTFDAYEYYEEKLQGLGEKFLAALLARYKDLSLHPTHYSFIEEDNTNTFRDVLLHKFPFTVVFEIIKKEVIVYAIHHTYKNPETKIRRY